MFYIYIIHSKSIDKFYVGQTLDIKQRISEHNSSRYSGSYTKVSSDWKLFFSICCENRTQAIKIESHIKKMKSRKYFENLKKFPDISQKIINKYK